MKWGPTNKFCLTSVVEKMRGPIISAPGNNNRIGQNQYGLMKGKAYLTNIIFCN